MSTNPLYQKHILLGVTGSIAAYKAADLASQLTQAGALVDTILTRAGTQFITPITFQSVTGRNAYTDADLWGTQAHVLHVGLARQADMLVIAPATATTIARLAHGTADDLLSLTALALGIGESSPPLLIAPAMDGNMYCHPATQANLKVLIERGAIIIGPEAGHLASGLVGKGRMTEPTDLLGHIRYLLSRNSPLKGKIVVVTAGGTQEALDPVRVLTNRSSGKQGLALAQAALDSGAEVLLIATPVVSSVPIGVRQILVTSATEMEQAVMKACTEADALIMAAAVADFHPVTIATKKIKKQENTLTIELKPTTDILKAVAKQREQTKRPPIVIGFAAETENLLANALEKLKSKGLNLIVANDISSPESGFSVDNNRVTILGADGSVEDLPLMSKTEVADVVINKLIMMLNKG
jgi:phosphopantothenoylcysteine decarboxylase/phosphopantothenate--cysteine ligase